MTASLQPVRSPGIDAQHRLRSERRRQQQLADVLGEHRDGGGVGHLAQRLVHLGVDRHRHVNAQRQPRRALEQRRARKSSARRRRRRAGGRLERRQQLVHQRIGGAVVAEAPAQRQHQLLLHPPAPHRQVAVRAGRLEQLLHRLLIREVVLEPAGGLGLVPLARARAAALEVGAAHLLAQAHVLRQPLDDDVGRARQRGRGVGDSLLRVDEGARARLGRLAAPAFAPCAAAPEPFRQRPQPRLPRRLGLGLSLLLVGKVEVFQRDRLERARECCASSSGVSFPCRADLLDDEALPLDQVVPALLGVEHLANRDLVQVPRLLLAVAGDERHGGAPLRQREHGVRAGLRARLRKLRVLLGQPERERQRHARGRLSISDAERSLNISEARRLIVRRA